MPLFFHRLHGTALCVALLSACSYSPTAHEQSLGNSVRQALTQQSVHPAGTLPERGPIVTDGVAASHGIDRYQQSFARPQPPMNVLNILASPGSGANANAVPGVPR